MPIPYRQVPQVEFWLIRHVNTNRGPSRYGTPECNMCPRSHLHLKKEHKISKEAFPRSEDMASCTTSQEGEIEHPNQERFTKVVRILALNTWITDPSKHNVQSIPEINSRESPVIIGIECAEFHSRSLLWRRQVLQTVIRIAIVQQPKQEEQVKGMRNVRPGFVTETIADQSLYFWKR